MNKKLYIKTYGCQMNVYDSQRMADILSPLGYEATESPEDADLAILNTCHIREKAEQKVYSDLGRLRDHRLTQHKKTDKDMIIAVGGCVAQAEGAEILRQAPYVDMVFGPQTYHRLPELIARATRARALKDQDPSYRGPGRGIVDIDFPAESKFDEIPQATHSPAAAFLTIQEGCDKFCTYCVVPYTRGAEFSRPAEEILKEAKHLASLGTKEIILLGQNVNAYHGIAPTASIAGTPQSEWGLAQLIEKVAQIEGISRIRYITSHPSDMTDDLIHAHRDIPQLMPYLHLPVQAGSNRVLEAMNRKHTRESYYDIIAQLREGKPDLALSSDFIVGFPGESDKDFQETVDLVNDIKYAQAYSFKYSIRPGTPGALMENQIPEDVKTERLAILQECIAKHQQEFNEKTVGKTLPILLESKGKKSGQIFGRSPYMQSVLVEGNDRLIGQLVDVEINAGHANSIRGSIVTVS